MLNRKKSRGLFGAAMLTGSLALLAGGCENAGRPHLRRAGAPGLAEARDAVNPNAPFTLHSADALPRLTTREPLLDVQAVPMCDPTKLSVFESGAQSNGNRHTVRFSLANNGPACKLGGFPSVSLLRADGSVLGDVQMKRISPETMAATLAAPGSAAVDDAFSVPSRPVLLPTRGEADFQLGWATGPECDQVSRIAIAAPGSTRSVILTRPLTVCESQILITPVAAE